MKFLHTIEESFLYLGAIAIKFTSNTSYLGAIAIKLFMLFFELLLLISLEQRVIYKITEEKHAQNKEEYVNSINRERYGDKDVVRIARIPVSARIAEIRVKTRKIRLKQGFRGLIAKKQNFQGLDLKKPGAGT